MAFAPPQGLSASRTLELVAAVIWVTTIAVTIVVGVSSLGGWWWSLPITLYVASWASLGATYFKAVRRARRRSAESA